MSLQTKVQALEKEVRSHDIKEDNLKYRCTRLTEEVRRLLAENKKLETRVQELSRKPSLLHSQVAQIWTPLPQ